MLQQSLKAIAAFVGTFLAALVVTLQDKTDVASMGLKEWGIAILAAFAVAVATWFTPNYNYPTKTPGT